MKCVSKHVWDQERFFGNISIIFSNINTQNRQKLKEISTKNKIIFNIIFRSLHLNSECMWGRKHMLKRCLNLNKQNRNNKLYLLSDVNWIFIMFFVAQHGFIS